MRFWRVAISPWKKKAYRTPKYPAHPALAIQHLMARQMIAVATDYRPWNLRFDVDRNISLFLETITTLRFSWMAELGTDGESGHVYIPFVQSEERQARWLGPYCVRLVRNHGLEPCGKGVADLVRTDSRNCLRSPLTLGREIVFTSGESFRIESHEDQVRAMRIYLKLRRCSYEEIRDRSLPTRKRWSDGEGDISGRSASCTGADGKFATPEVSRAESAPGAPPRPVITVSFHSRRTARARVREGALPRDHDGLAVRLAQTYPDTCGRRFELQPFGIGWLLRQGLGPEDVADVALVWLQATGSWDARDSADKIREDLVRLARKMIKDTRKGHGGGTHEAAQVVAGREGRSNRRQSHEQAPHTRGTRTSHLDHRRRA